jgi:hypothetical protein
VQFVDAIQIDECPAVELVSPDAALLNQAVTLRTFETAVLASGIQRQKASASFRISLNHDLNTIGCGTLVFKSELSLGVKRKCRPWKDNQRSQKVGWDIAGRIG